MSGHPHLDTRLLDALLRGVAQGASEPLVEAACEAAEQLGALGNPKAVGPLVRALSTPSALLREAICDALGELADLRATNPLLSALRDEHEEVRGAALAALLQIGQRRASEMPSAEAWARGFADPTAVMTQIAWQTDMEAVKLLESALTDPDPEVKIGAIYTLCHLGIQPALTGVSQLACHDPDEDVRAAAAYGLGELAVRGAPEAANNVMQTLTWLWQQPQGDEVRGAILRAVSELEHPAGAPLCESALSGEVSAHDPIARQVAVMALGRLRDPSALPSLTRALTSDPHAGVRRNAAYALGFLMTPAQGRWSAQLSASQQSLSPDKLAQEVARALVSGAAGQGGEIRAAIGASLKRVDRMSALTAIAEVLRGPDEEGRAGAAYLLGHVPDQLGLAEALQDPSPLVRKRACLATGSARLSALRPTLEGLLSDEAWEVRVASAEGLKRLGDAQALHALSRHRADPHPVVQSAVEAAISGLSSPL